MVGDSDNDNRSDRPMPGGLQDRLEQAGMSFAYPPTPNIAVQQRQWVQQRAGGRLDGKPGSSAMPQRPPAVRHNWPGARVLLGAALALVLLFASLLLVTPVRARLLEWLRIGAVRIFLEENPTPAVTVLPTSLSGLAGETTLAEAAAQASFSLWLPAYPPDLKDPQRVYLQQVNDTTVVIFVWQEPDAPEKVRLALYQIGEGDAFQKQLIRNMKETTVNGQWALWVEGPYLLSRVDGQVDQRRIVSGHTLIWSANGLTYRLETGLPVDEARKIAESLKEWDQK